MTVQWPGDPDGDVMRRLHAQGFNFEEACRIDFNVDFLSWPPSQAAMAWLENQFPELTVHATADGGGYVQFQVHHKLTYELVIEIQDRVSQAMAEFGGVCESWGVLH